MNMKEIEDRLKHLLDGEFTSLSLTYNDHSVMYRKADGYYEFDNREWVSQDDYLKAMMENSVWELTWHPNTPVGSCMIRASRLTVLLEWLDDNFPQDPELLKLTEKVMLHEKRDITIYKTVNGKTAKVDLPFELRQDLKAVMGLDPYREVYRLVLAEFEKVLPGKGKYAYERLEI